MLVTPRLMGDVNRSRILQALVDNGPTSRAELARLAGVPRASIGAIVQNLVNQELVEELEPNRDTGKVGKPGRPVWFAPGAGLSVAALIVPGGVRAAAVTARGEILRESATTVDTGSLTAPQLLAVTREQVSSVIGPGETPLGIGVSIPGICAADGTVIASGQVPGAGGSHLRDELGLGFGLPVMVDNDARAQALGEKWFGDGRGVPTFAAIQTGTGLGVGLVLSGVLFRGEDGLLGELGHIPVERGGALCTCGLHGCWETVASLRWLRAQAQQIGLPGGQAIDSAALTALGEPGETLLADYAARLGTGLAVLVTLLGVRRLFLHGDVIGGGEPLRVLIETATRDQVLPNMRDEVVVGFSSLDADAGLLGAAGLVLSDRFKLAV